MNESVIAAPAVGISNEASNTNSTSAFSLQPSALPLWRSDAVEARRIIRPVRIAEIERVAGEGVGLQRRPGGTGRIRAGFHHDDHVAGPGDVEAELIGPHPKAVIAGLYGEIVKRRSVY